MSMRKRAGGMILDCAPAAELDPGNLCKPLAKPKAEPICHCAPQQKARLGGMDPRIDLEANSIRCATCFKEIGPACRTRRVSHLRGLLQLKEKLPDQFDLDDCRDAGFLLEVRP